MVDDLHTKKKADQRTALLGLAADKDSGRQGQCLTVLEMSEFLDEKCSESERQAFFTHLSSCDRCVREWLELDDIIKGKKGRGQTPRLLRPGMLTIGGSLLAAAASLMFFLNLNYESGPGKAPSSAVPKLQMEKTAEIAKALPGLEKAVQPASASPEIKRERRSLSVQANMAKQRGQEPIKELEGTSRAAAVSAQHLSVSPMEDPVQRWFDKVEEGCRAGNSEQELWIDLARHGAGLLLKDHFSALPAVVGQVNRLARGEDRVQGCMEIQRILAESRKE